MKDVLTPIQLPPKPEDGASGVQYRPVSALEVGLESTSQTVAVRLWETKNKRYFDFVLSPPAAAQLSRQLRKAVKAYLRSETE